MGYLYGDSSASQLSFNFIDFLKDAMDFSVAVLVADRHIRQGVERAVGLRRAAGDEQGRLEALGATVSSAVERASLGDGDSATARCAELVLRSTGGEVREAIERVKARLALDLGQLDEGAARERGACMQALSTLLLRHDLPEWTVELGLEWQGARYVGVLRAKAPFGLQVSIDLEIGPNHLAAHIVRLDKVVERLEVHTPEEGGWLRKEVRLRPQRLEKEYLTNLQIGATETTFKLRANPDGTGDGYDESDAAQEPRELVTRAGQGEDPPFALNDADAALVIELQQKLVLACADLGHSRKAVVGAWLDGTPIREHADPKLLAERLIETITPTVKEFARRSSPTELRAQAPARRRPPRGDLRLARRAAIAIGAARGRRRARAVRAARSRRGITGTEAGVRTSTCRHAQAGAVDRARAHAGHACSSAGGERCAGRR